jgi:hypothetical protein
MSAVQTVIRSIVWTMILGLAALILVGILGAYSKATAATINVSARCTLQQAIQAANADRPVAGCPAGSGMDVINLAAKSYVIGTRYYSNAGLFDGFSPCRPLPVK